MQKSRKGLLDEPALKKLRRIAPNMLANMHAARQGSWQTRTLPEEIAFKLTNRCDLRCKHCYQWNEGGYHRQLDLHAKGGDLDLNIIGKALTATHMLKSNVYLWGGEPLAYQHWDGLVKLLVDDPRWIAICTNGTLIKKRLNGLLALSSQLEVSISLDGFEMEHDLLRGTGAFKRTLDGLRLLVREKQKNAYQFEIAINFFITDIIIPKMCHFVSWLESEGVDTVYISFPWFLSADANMRMDGFFSRHFGGAHVFAKPSWYSYNYRLSLSRVDELSYQIQQLKQLPRTLKLRFNPDLSPDELATFISGSDQPAQSKTRCQAILTRMDIFPDGQVVSCKFFPEFVMGSLVNNDLSAVWNSERFNHQRETIATCGLMPVCAKCNLLYTRGG